MSFLQRTSSAARPAIFRCRAALSSAPAIAARHSSTSSTASPTPNTRRPAATTAIQPSMRGHLAPAAANQNSRQASTTSEMYTASFAFFEAIWEAGITHCFVNLGSDHPSIIEAMVKGQKEAKGKFPRIITCPNEVSFTIYEHLSTK